MGGATLCFSKPVPPLLSSMSIPSQGGLLQRLDLCHSCGQRYLCISRQEAQKILYLNLRTHCTVTEFSNGRPLRYSPTLHSRSQAFNGASKLLAEVLPKHFPGLGGVQAVAHPTLPSTLSSSFATNVQGLQANVHSTSTYLPGFRYPYLYES